MDSDQGSPRLSRGHNDRAAELRADEAAVALAWREGRVRLLTLGSGGTLPVTSQAGGPRLRWELSLPWQEPPSDAWLLGRDREGTLLLAITGGDPGGSSLLEVGADLPDDDAGPATAATALHRWHATHGFCPADGAATRVTASGWVRICDSCGAESFPRTDPAVIVLVTDPTGERAVLGRAQRWPAGQFSCLAGFVEAGESAEQAVVREVMEEAGVPVHRLWPVVSQPWPFPRSLMLGFRAITDAEAVPVGTDGELAEVAWFDRDDVRSGAVLVPPAVSVAHHLIAGWLAGAP